jgi:hypothetical protein
MKSKLALAAFALALLLYAGIRIQAGSGFEQRARAAEQLAAQQKPELAALQHQRDSLQATLAHRRPTLAAAPATIAVVDSVSHPDASCQKSLAIRDQTIADQNAQLATYQALAASQDGTVAAVTLARDSALAALAARPHPLLRLPFLQITRPQPAAFLGVCLGGHPCAGVGVSIQFSVGAP